MPFYVRTGKRLARQTTEVRVHLKRTPHALFARTPDEQVEPNLVVISIQPDEGIVLQFGAKKPGGQMQVVPVQANFSCRTAFGGNTPIAYQTLLPDAMRGDEAWAQLPVPDFPNYPAGSEGPRAAEELIRGELRGWHMIAAALRRSIERPNIKGKGRI